MRFRCPCRPLNLFGLRSRRDSDSSEDQGPQTLGFEQSAEAIPTTGETTNIHPNNLNVETIPTEQQNGDQVCGSPSPKEGFPDARSGNDETHSSRSDSLDLRRGSFSSLQDSSQKENESPSEEKIRRLSQAIEKGHEVRYLFNRASGGYDVYASTTPGDDEEGSDDEVEQSLLVEPLIPKQHMLTPLQGLPQKENESPSHETINRASQAIETDRHIRYLDNLARGEYDVFASPSPSDDERGLDDEVKQSLPLELINPQQRMLTPLQGLSQKENESPAHEPGDIFPSHSSDDNGEGPDGEVEQRLPIETTHSGQHILSPFRRSSQKENICPDERFGRVIETTEMGHQIHLRSSEEIHDHDILGHASSDSKKGLADDVRHGFSEAPTFSGQDMQGRSPTDGISNAIAPGPSHLGEIPRLDQKSVHPSKAESCEDEIAVGKPKIEVDQDWSSDEDERCERSTAPKGSAEEDRGDLLAVMVRGKKIFRKISPIPFDLHKAPPIQTPSVSSHGTESENESSACSRSYSLCLGAVNQRNQEFVLTSIEGPEFGKTNSSEEHPQDIKVCLDNTESSFSSPHHEAPGALEISQDPEHNGVLLSGEQEETSRELKSLRNSDNGSASSWREQEDTAEAFELGNLSPPEGPKGTPRGFETCEDDELGDLSPDGNHEETAASFEIWEDNELSSLSPDDEHKETAACFEIWEDNEPSSFSPDDEHEETAASFEIWEDSELSSLSPDDEHKETAACFEIWEDNELSSLSPDDEHQETAAFFEIWEDHELDNRSPTGKQRENAASFKVWNDAEHGRPAASQQITALAHGALSDVTDMARRRFLQMVDSAGASAVEWEMKNCIDARRVASLTKAKRLPHSGAFPLGNEAEWPEVGQAHDILDALSAWQGYSIGQASGPPNSLSSSVVSSNGSSSMEESRSPVPQHRDTPADPEFHSRSSSPPVRVAIDRATRIEGQHRQQRSSAPAESCPFTRGRLAGFVSAQPCPPTPRLAQPAPRRYINPEALLEHFDSACSTETALSKQTAEHHSADNEANLPGSHDSDCASHAEEQAI